MVRIRLLSGWDRVGPWVSPLPFQPDAGKVRMCPWLLGAVVVGHGICEGWGHQPSQFREAGRTKGTDCRSAQGRCQNRPGEGSSVTLTRGEGRGGKGGRSLPFRGLRERVGEEGMATHVSILAWRIPWTEEPRGLPLGRCPSSFTSPWGSGGGLHVHPAALEGLYH